MACLSPTVLAQSGDEKPAPAAVTQFKALRNVHVVPMASVEMEAVKGLHVHFFTPSKNVVETPFGPMEGIHLAGDVKTENNWSSDWGGSDGVAVAPSYKGLCTATGLSGPGTGIVSMPQGYQQCPLP
jgi:hypothetical protein